MCSPSFLNLLARIPSYNLKSQLRTEIRRLSLGFREFIFFGLGQKFIIAMRMETVGEDPEKMLCVTMQRGSPRESQHSLYTKPVIPSDPVEALRLDAFNVLKISSLDGIVSSIELSLSETTASTKLSSCC